ncbi:hypothetical protein HanPSC8_Chr01g0038881 [Helianthus annuus]|nr:hypothetical protein HanPSC8_Chr01g0038881 [Helianthus annuus]
MEMEQKHTCASICDQLPTLSSNHPWLVDHNLEEDDNRDHIVYTMRDPPTQRRCRIPSPLGRRIRGCFYGWVILSNHPHNDMWSLWNPETSKIICLPRLITEYAVLCSDTYGVFASGTIQQCCLSSPPDDPGSIFMVTAAEYTLFFCRLDCKRKRLKWVEMSYAQQMRSIAGCDSILYCLTCCNGNVYALNNVPGNRVVIHLDIVVKDKGIVISLLPCLKLPAFYEYRYMYDCPNSVVFLKGCCTELFCIKLGLNKRGHVEKQSFGGVCVFKLDMTNKRWEQVEDLNDATFFLDLAHDCSAFYSPTIASELGGYVHFLDKSAKVTYSFDFKNKTIALSSMPSLVLPTKLFGCRQQGEPGEIKSQQENEVVVRDDEVDSNNMSLATREENIGSRLLNIPLDVLKTIMGFCVGIEYLNFRATCKLCHLVAPMIRWSKGGRLQNYSLASPWLMMLDKDRGVISFTDPKFGDKYFIKTPQELIGNVQIHCSMGGWLLIRRHDGPLMFFNPFTSDTRELPFAPYFDTYCFSAPPTASDCMVVGFTTRTEWHVYVHFVAREPSWRRFHLKYCCDSHTLHFATRYGKNLYALYNNGGVGFIDTGNLVYTGVRGLTIAGNLDYVWREGPRSSCVSPKQSFLTKCDQQLLLVIVGEFGECVEVFKLNDSTKWEKTESLGRHAVYICGKACLCVEAKTPEMANKIYFPRFHSKNRKIVFYSLATRRYHTFNGQDIEESFGDFMGTKHYIDPHVWIEPSWS